MTIKELTKVYQTTDGKVFATMAEAERHEDVEMRRHAIGVLRDYAKFAHGVSICASGIDEALTRFGFVFDPKKFDQKEVEYVEKLAGRARGVYSSEDWTGRRARYPS